MSLSTPLQSPPFEFEEGRAIPADMTLFVMLNPLATPNPVAHWFEQEWAGCAAPLYALTPMESIVHASPWLVAVPWSHAQTILQWADTQDDPSWGWLYASRAPWTEQKAHWQQYLRVLIGDDLRAIRFHDPRIIAIWLTANEPQLWAGLLAPVEVLRLPSGQVFTRAPGPCPPNTTYPWPMPVTLTDAWHCSEPGIESALFNLHLTLWRDHQSQADQWDTDDSPFTDRLRPWLAELAATGKAPHLVSFDDALAWLVQQQGDLTA